MNCWSKNVGENLVSAMVVAKSQDLNQNFSIANNYHTAGVYDLNLSFMAHRSIVSDSDAPDQTYNPNLN